MEYEVFFFFCQTIPSCLRISGAKAYYFPSCNLNLLNCLQTHFFSCSTMGKTQCFGSKCDSLLFFSLQNPTSFGDASSLFHRKFGQEHLFMKTSCFSVLFFFFSLRDICHCIWQVVWLFLRVFQTRDVVTF